MSTKYSRWLHILLDGMDNIVSKLYEQITDDNNSKYYCIIFSRIFQFVQFSSDS